MKIRCMIQWIPFETADDAGLNSGDFEKTDMALWYLPVDVRFSGDQT
jgi:hypothetical protein